MKILMVHNSLGVSGANTYLEAITALLRKSGHSVNWLIIGREAAAFPHNGYPPADSWPVAVVRQK